MKTKQQHLTNKKTQIFSMDIIVVTMIILITIGFLIFGQLNSLQQKTNNHELLEEKSEKSSQKIIENFQKSQIIKNDENIDINKLKTLNYEKLKNELGIKQDFAIILEKNGSLLKITQNSYCIGTEKIKIKSQKCIN